MKLLSTIIEGMFDVEDDISKETLLMSLEKCFTYSRTWSPDEDVCNKFDFEESGNTLKIYPKKIQQVNWGSFITCPDFPQHITEIEYYPQKHIIDNWFTPGTPKGKTSPVKRFVIHGDLMNISWFPKSTEIVVDGDLTQEQCGLPMGTIIKCKNLYSLNGAVLTGYKRLEIYCEKFYTHGGSGMTGKWLIKDGDDVVLKNYSMRGYKFLTQMNLKDLKPKKKYDVIPEDSTIQQKFNEICKWICTKPHINEIVFVGQDSRGEWRWIINSKKSYLKRI